MILVSECVQDLVLLIWGSQEGCSIAFVTDVPLSTDWQRNGKRHANQGKTSGGRKAYIYFHRQEFKVEKNPFALLLFYFPLVSDPKEQLWVETSRASIGCWAAASRYYWPKSLTGPKSSENTSCGRICFDTGRDVVRRGIAEYWWKQTTYLKEIIHKVAFNNCLCLEQASKSWILVTVP